MKRIAGLICLTLIINLATTAQSWTNKNTSGKARFQLPQGITQQDYREKTVVLKVKDEFRNLCSDQGIQHQGFNDLLNALGVVSFGKKFPKSPIPRKTHNELGQAYADISLIYELKYSQPHLIEYAINGLLDLDLFVYVEPRYKDFITFVPNDPELGTQWHLAKVKAYEAWDIQKGDSSIIVAIIDTGFDIDHIDLKDNVAYNYADPINGIDDDGDGYIDNFRGWDLVDNDNNPQIGFSDHGIHVAGCAVTTPHNGVGGAGVGYNTRLMPLKAGDGGGISHGYEGIVYAAEHGADFINCSWGNFTPNAFSQDIITYATINHDALVTCGAGNKGTEDLFYPASYDYALSVGSTTPSDARAGFSEFNYRLDVMTPGQDIWSTIDSSKYGYNFGTSMSAPMAAGIAAIIKAEYPWLNALQIKEQLCVTADNIDTVPPNQDKANKLGCGRVNMLTALGGINSPSVVMSQQTYSDNNDNVFRSGDTLRISGVFTNYLAQVTGLGAILTTTSTHVNILDGNSTLGDFNTLEVKNNFNDPFEVVINNSMPMNEEVLFRVNLTNGTYSRLVFITMTLNADYIDIAVNEVATSITSFGKIGYNNITNTEGLGFTFQGSASLLYEAGLMIGLDDGGTSKVVDAVRSSANTIDDDFAVQQTVFKSNPDVVSDFDVEGRFDDSNGGSEELGLEIDHHAYAWTDPGHTRYVIVEYELKNTSGADLIDLYAGMFADWDVVIPQRNRGAWDPVRYMGYTYYYQPNNPYAGIQLLTSQTGFSMYAIDNVIGGNGGIDITGADGYNPGEKLLSMQTNRTGTGFTGQGVDVAQVVATGPFTINDGDSFTLAFAILAGEDLEDLQQSADSAYQRYNGSLPTSVNPVAGADDWWLGQNFPNPVDGQTTLEFSIPESDRVTLELTDLMGRPIRLLLDREMAAGTHQLSLETQGWPAGVYFYRLQYKNGQQVRKMILR